MVIILVWALKKANIKDFFAARSREIKQTLEDLQREKEEAEAKFREIEAKLKDFEEEKKHILEQYRREGEAEKAKIIDEANNRVEDILTQAELTIRQETESAKSRLKQEMVEIAAQKAEEIIAERITEDDQDSLVDDFIERVGKIH
jgi:F-type H+-transporting ATPase subunit b